MHIHPTAMNQDQLSLDKQRVSLLLNINTLLIQKSIMLQHQLKEQQQQQQQQQQSSNLSKLTELLQHLLKRLHSNLTCIGELSERQNNNSPAQQKKLIFPTILNPPPEFFEFNEYYIALQKLFPEGVAVLTQRIKQQMNGQIPGGTQQQQQQQQQQIPSALQQNTAPQQQQQQPQPQQQHQQQQQQQFW